MMTLELHYVGGVDPVVLEEVSSYAPLVGWFVVYFADEGHILYPTDRIEQIDVMTCG